MKFENRNNSDVPIIQRLDYDGKYLYIIKIMTGCDCNYAGCENYKIDTTLLKVREYSGKIVKTNKGKQSVVHITLHASESSTIINEDVVINEDAVISFYNKNYK